MTPTIINDSGTMDGRYVWSQFTAKKYLILSTQLWTCLNWLNGESGVFKYKNYLMINFTLTPVWSILAIHLDKYENNEKVFYGSM
jgi:hypothetical protein